MGKTSCLCPELAQWQCQPKLNCCFENVTMSSSYYHSIFWLVSIYYHIRAILMLIGLSPSNYICNQATFSKPLMNNLVHIIAGCPNINSSLASFTKWFVAVRSITPTRMSITGWHSAPIRSNCNWGFASGDSGNRPVLHSHLKTLTYLGFCASVSQLSFVRTSWVQFCYWCVSLLFSMLFGCM